jgi:hypothetical protein
VKPETLAGMGLKPLSVLGFGVNGNILSQGKNVAERRLLKALFSDHDLRSVITHRILGILRGLLVNYY